MFNKNAIWKMKNSWEQIRMLVVGKAGINKQTNFNSSEKEVFHLILIKPTKYDDVGFAIHWLGVFLPNNSMAVVNGLAQDAASREVLGKNTEIRITIIDESASVPDHERLIEQLRKSRQKALVCLVGVQSNQFPRALDVARQFRRAGVVVCIGGFHVSGCLALYEKLPPELIAAQNEGISLFAGELEDGRLDQLLLDCQNQALQPVYNFLDRAPAIDKSPYPYYTDEMMKGGLSNNASIDLGRGCPFGCNFCCIINVQGHKSRSRPVEKLESYVRDLWDRGVREIFITDDNFSRNARWESYLDSLRRIRTEGRDLHVTIQVDAISHKIPGFIEKCVAAGVRTVFIGLENINPENLAAMNKGHNDIADYRELLIAWKKHPVIVLGAYIIGLPGDTRESILQDVETIKQELPVDVLALSIFTPLPGSELHMDMLRKGVQLDSDLNKYDLIHSVMRHPHMTEKELNQTYRDAMDIFYDFDHMKTIMKRTFGLGSNRKTGLVINLFGAGVWAKTWGVSGFDVGRKRIYSRRSYRYEISSIKLALLQYKEILKRGLLTLLAFYRYHRINAAMLDLWANPDRLSYRDKSIYPESVESTQSTHSRG